MKAGHFLGAVWLALSIPLCPARAENRTNTSTSGTAVVHIVDGPALESVLNRNKGRVIVLNLWATWCVPCREEIPELVRLHRIYRRQGLHLVLLSIDQPQALASVKEYLRKSKVNFVSYLSMEPHQNPRLVSLDPGWSGTLPSTFIFNRQGRRVKTLLGKQSFEHLAKALEPFL
jgi:thiol-disulfide isomerase/thioredoxin